MGKYKENVRHMGAGGATNGGFVGVPTRVTVESLPFGQPSKKEMVDDQEVERLYNLVKFTFGFILTCKNYTLLNCFAFF